MPKVSVIIPTYNRASLIQRALDSVLAQTFRDFEVIVVDDGSTDKTKEVLAPYDGRIKYIYQNNGGISEARNRGIRESLGVYITFLDSDDYWTPEKLAEQVKVLDANTNVGIVYARMPIINAKGEKIGMKPAGASGKNFKELVEIWGDLPTSTVMTRKECLDKVGLFDPALPPMEDIDLWLRISRHYDLYEIEGKVLAYYSAHDNQITRDKYKVHNGLIKVYNKILNTFPDAPQKLMHERIALNEYQLSRIYYNDQRYQQAWQHLTAAFRSYPQVGVLLINKKGRPVKKFIAVIKTYGYWMVCFLQMIFIKPLKFINPASRRRN